MELVAGEFVGAFVGLAPESLVGTAGCEPSFAVLFCDELPEGWGVCAFHFSLHEPLGEAKAEVEAYYYSGCFLGHGD